ncbi:glycogen debranching N-terminal domain-containing protein [Acidithiobacillus sp. M4-SHS-6]|uniref:amylo-alpha-1,6-glucosidase n=1 Tax=Acidithiobacillus sp. M4-SHS-6 TaxID=3383024 RepID=UPI0039BDF1B6
MDDAIQIDNRWYIPATSSRADDRIRVLKSDDGFVVFSRHGELGRAGLGEQGFYHLGMRHLSGWHLLLEGREPMLLNSTIRLDNSRLEIDQTTPDLFKDGALWLPKGVIHLHRELAASDSTLTERLTLTNYHGQARRLRLEYHFDADFRDIFEIRGTHRERRGKRHPPELLDDAVILAYTGLDGVTRRTRIGFEPRPSCIAADAADFDIALKPRTCTIIEVAISCDSGNTYFCVPNYSESVGAIERKVDADRHSRAEITTDNEQFNDWINRSVADLQMLTTQTRYGPYPYAGVPWFSTPFGRDGLITALQTLWAQPVVARGVLAFLAATQAERTDPASEAEPGKIIHEMREGEMAALGEVPFRRYYGSVDATPLFVMLAGHYYRRSGERDFIGTIWPSLERAMAWVTSHLDRHGFLVYAPHGDKGLVHQGWKDSDDAVFHADGRPPAPPIALCEVQGYAYAAALLGAELAEVVGETRMALRWRAQAERLRERFEAAFWLEEPGFYALALDGEGAPCAVRSSNIGHLLYTGIADPARAARMAQALVSPEAFNGWGLRTVFEGEARYNPMSYHNGSVWPHDTAIAAAGMARYGRKSETLRLLEGLFNAAIRFDLHRLPELFCGFERLSGQAPAHYPVACAPQAWASGAVFMLIDAILGLHFDPAIPTIHLHHPRIPDYIDWLRIRGLKHLGGELDLMVRRHGDDIAVNIERRQGNIELNVTV